MRVSLSQVYPLVFYLAIVKKNITSLSLLVGTTVSANDALVFSTETTNGHGVKRLRMKRTLENLRYFVHETYIMGKHPSGACHNSAYAIRPSSSQGPADNIS